MKRRTRKPLLVHLVLLSAASVMLIPLAWMVSTSLKQSGIGMSRSVEWLPWRDVYDGTPVIVLSALVRLDGAGGEQEPLDPALREELPEDMLSKLPSTTHPGLIRHVGIKSLASRDRFCDVFLPEGHFRGETLGFRVRPITGDEATAEAEWVRFESVRRRLAPQWSNYTEALKKMRFWRVS